MKIDTDLVYARIESLLHDPVPVASKMNSVIDACEAGYPHDGWRVLRELPYDEETNALRAWIPRVLRDEPPPLVMRGVWIGIGNYAIGDRVTADMHFIGSAFYDPADRDQIWAVRAGYWPADGAADSNILDAIYDIAYRTHPELENDAEWSLCLAYTAFAVADILRNETPAYFGAASEIGVVVGFDDGDSVTIGRVTDQGLVAR